MCKDSFRRVCMRGDHDRNKRVRFVKGVAPVYVCVSYVRINYYND